MPTMIGKWDEFHTKMRPYGNPQTYEIASRWLSSHGLVEDWGCGAGWAKQFFVEYSGLDGSGPFCDRRVDLTRYRSEVPCILLRHVLEHNLDWRLILDNMLGSFISRAAIVLFMPLERAERVAGWEHGIPNIHLPEVEFLKMILPYLEHVEYAGDESVFLLEKCTTSL